MSMGTAAEKKPMLDKRVFTWGAAATVCAVVGVPVYFFQAAMKEKQTNPIVIYLENKFHSSDRDVVTQFFTHIPKAPPDGKALVLGALINEKDLIFPLQKNYHVIAVDDRVIFYDLMIPDYKKYKNKVTIIDEPNLDELPEFDLVMARFILPFYSQTSFQTLWRGIDEKLKPNGYFIGNFFDPDLSVFSRATKANMALHTKKQVRDLFDGYAIINLQEIKRAVGNQEGVEHYYDVLARKHDKYKH